MCVDRLGLSNETYCLLRVKYRYRRVAGLFAVLMLGLPITAFAQQFGLNMGETPQQVRAKGVKLIKDGENIGWWDANYLPYGNSSFDSYSLLFGAKTGLCKIFATTPAIMDSGYGNLTIAKYESYKRTLNQRYGEGRAYEFLKSGAIWSGSNEWMWSLSKKERSHVVYWGTDGQAINRKNIKTIKLEALGLTQDASMIMVTYEFNNISECLNERNEVNGSNL